ncbi:MAG: FAD:protein FMN transferase [Acidimicrobiia bacterium]
MSTQERVIEVMGTTAQVIAVDGPAGMVDDAVAELEALESRWSRFRPDSEISRLNERPGVPVLVSPTTFELIERAVEGWLLTAGRFDPTLLSELRAAGYDRSFELVGVGGPHDDIDGSPASVLTRPTASRGERITLDRIAGTVTLGADVQIDPGGIGKGLAADLVVERMLADGARGALANVGGDLRVEGVGPDGAGWVVAVTDPTHADDVIRTVALDAGAVASTWRTKRAWLAPDGTARHHLIDPTTGRPAASGLAGVTVITGRGWQAEVLAKAAFLAGAVTGGELLEDHGVAGLLVADDGTTHEVGAWARFRV